MTDSNDNSFANSLFSVCQSTDIQERYKRGIHDSVVFVYLYGFHILDHSLHAESDEPQLGFLHARVSNRVFV